MVTQEDLESQYSQYTTDQLFDIIQKNSGYTDLAISVAETELRRRNVPAGEIKERMLTQIPIPEYVLENYLEDMSVWEKMLFFLVMWIPRVRWYFSPNFIADGYKLKSQQGSYYATFGFFAFISTLGAAFFPLCLMSYPAIFILAYLFDLLYNRDKQIQYMQKKVDEGRDPMDEFS